MDEVCKKSYQEHLVLLQNKKHLKYHTEGEIEGIEVTGGRGKRSKQRLVDLEEVDVKEKALDRNLW